MHRVNRAKHYPLEDFTYGLDEETREFQVFRVSVFVCGLGPCRTGQSRQREDENQAHNGASHRKTSRGFADFGTFTPALQTRQPL